MVGWFLAKTTMGIMLCRLPDWRTLAPGAALKTNTNL